MFRRTLQRCSCHKQRVSSEERNEEANRREPREEAEAIRSTLVHRRREAPRSNQSPIQVTMSPTILHVPPPRPPTNRRRTERARIPSSSNPQEEEGAAEEERIVTSPTIRPKKKKYDKSFWLPADVYESLLLLQEESLYIVGTVLHRNLQGAFFVRESLSLVQFTSATNRSMNRAVYLQTLPMYIAYSIEPPFSERTLAGLFYQLATIVQTLHHPPCRLLHGYLHLNNVLVHPQTHQMSLSGLQYCAYLSSRGHSAPRPFVPPAHRYDWYAFRAPEWDTEDDDNNDGTITAAADIWSLGVILYTCCTGGIPPFCGRGDALVAAKRHGRFLDVQRISPGVSLLCTDLIQQCVHVRPLQRASIDRVLQHPWLRGAARAARRSLDPPSADAEEDDEVFHEEEDADLSLAQSLFGDW